MSFARHDDGYIFLLSVLLQTTCRAACWTLCTCTHFADIYRPFGISYWLSDR